MKEISDRPLHAALEVLTSTLSDKNEKTRVIGAKCWGLMHGYDQRWRNAPYLIDSVERVMYAPLTNPETGRSSRTFKLGGKLDVRARDAVTGEWVIFDHKTTSEDITDPNGPYWRQLVIESQVSQYMLLDWLNGNKVDYGLWDVIKKPGISPKEVAKKDAAIVIAHRLYYQHELSDDEMDEFQKTQRETTLMYAARLHHDCGTERPDRYFQRRKVARLDAEIREYAIEAWDHGQEIIAARSNERWPRNSGACFTYNTPCKFLSLCSGHDSLDSGNWGSKHWVHPELPQPEDGRGVDILTNSRIRTFQTCRRKHQLLYEIGVNKVDEEEREALFLGNLWHSANEAYFLQLKAEQEKP